MTGFVQKGQQQDETLEEQLCVGNAHSARHEVLFTTTIPSSWGRIADIIFLHIVRVIDFRFSNRPTAQREN